VNLEAEPAMSDKMPEKFVEKKAAGPHSDEEEDNGRIPAPDAPTRNK